MNKNSEQYKHSEWAQGGLVKEKPKYIKNSGFVVVT